jgi:hypothetical protein
VNSRDGDCFTNKSTLFHRKMTCPGSYVLPLVPPQIECGSLVLVLIVLHSMPCCPGMTGFCPRSRLFMSFSLGVSISERRKIYHNNKG